MTTWRGIILGEAASKANSRKAAFIGKGDHRRMIWIKSDKARAYEKSARAQLPELKVLLMGPLRASFRMFYATQRPDLDPSLVLDVLQGRIYFNDRQVRELHCFHAIDAANPRVEIEIEALQPQQAGLQLPATGLTEALLGAPLC